MTFLLCCGKQLGFLLYSFLMDLGTEAWSWHCSSRELDGEGLILPRVAMLRQHGMLSFRQAEQ